MSAVKTRSNTINTGYFGPWAKVFITILSNTHQIKLVPTEPFYTALHLLLFCSTDPDFYYPIKYSSNKISREFYAQKGMYCINPTIDANDGAITLGYAGRG